MSNVINLSRNSNDGLYLPPNPNPVSVVGVVSVHIAEYSAANGGRDAGEETLYAVEVLYPDGTWEGVGYDNDYGVACSVALGEADVRDAVLLDECVWPSRKVEIA